MLTKGRKADKVKTSKKLPCNNKKRVSVGNFEKERRTMVVVFNQTTDVAWVTRCDFPSMMLMTLLTDSVLILSRMTRLRSHQLCRMVPKCLSHH